VKKDKLESKLHSLPVYPGVYRFLDDSGEVIYVGKAKNLRNRVRSYFRVVFDRDTKTKALVENICDLEIIEVSTELEALILEEKLIKKYQPKYNILLKDDKSFLYIVIRDNFVKINGNEINFPMVFSARKTDLKDGDYYFGPYPRASVAKYVLRTLRKIIPFRDCPKSKFQTYQRVGKACLYGHLGLCQAPCLQNFSSREYQKDIRRLIRFLEGKFKKIMEDVQKEMMYEAKNENFEEAAKLRDILKKFEYLTINSSKIDSIVENPKLIEDTISESLDGLVREIPVLRDYPERIECYDISNISGKEATGAMTVAINGRLTNSEYRRFKIKIKETPDDYEMMREVLRRRFKRSLKEDSWELPNLVVVDGGSGQLNAGIGVMEEVGVEVPMIGIAKKEENLIYKDRGQFHEVKLPLTHEGLKLIQRLRDEAHRFSRKYHYQLRVKKLLS
jgi:excinuclease ABC subunit C